MKGKKCECGHLNPEGATLCEACGKPLEESQQTDASGKKQLLNMRYDGSARRSQTYNKSIIDKVWNFFSSVKVGVWLIVLTIIASAIGSIFPQEMYIPADAPNRDPAVFYEDRYGIIGLIYFQLGLHNLYSSWWYILLIALIGVSLVIASIDRVVPLYKALKMQKAKRHESFISRQRLFSETEHVSEADLEKIKGHLRKKRYRLREENGHILAEKNRFSRWGPYVNHIGLIIILLAAILRFSDVLYMDEYVWVREGETVVLPGTDREYYIENHDFILETYDEDDERFSEAIAQEGTIPRNFQTNVTIYRDSANAVAGAEAELTPITEDQIRLNEPLKFEDYTLYQSGYQQNEFTSMSFKVHETDDPEEEALANFTIDLTSPDGVYELDNGFRVELGEYYPDYYLDDNGIPASRTDYPRNPAFVLFVYPPGSDTAEVSFLGIGKNIEPTGENEYNVGITDFEMRDASGLTVRVDHTLPFFGAGAAIFMIGVIQGMYWHHRRIWIHPKGNGVLLGAHTNKNWYGVEKDIEQAIDGTSINMVKDQQEKDE
ncbi:cytochrome c biogenesis protein ResB [Lentibacillus sediminis]|uniref:cytochrome c biogenesis protein ResB n=1 Tax=Lentibacillus sediminis TaxID=1940529 RepID=UPI000C1BF733|nr:cytochrome c biogenesis protein ResB [Lentibacillus sediminis]